MKEVSEIFNIEIKDSELFKHALTHPSYTKGLKLPYDECYERLEFLGDAVLKLAVSRILYKMYPDYTEGNMSRIRGVVVSDATLADICGKTGLAHLIIAAKHDEKQGCKKVESVRACAFEAVLGAYYLEGKLNKLIKFLQNVMKPYIEDADKNFEKYNAKALLQEYTQKSTKEVPEYVLIDEKISSKTRTFTVEVKYQGEVLGTGEGKTKKEAEQHAAYSACQKLGVLKNA